MIPDRIFPTDDMRQAKRACTETKPINPLLSCLPLEMIKKLQVHSTKKDLCSFSASCKALYDVFGYDHIWLKVCEKVGLFPKVEHDIITPNTLQPLSADQNKRLEKVILSEKPMHQLSIDAPYRNIFFKYVALHPLNEFKFHLTALELRKKVEGTKFTQKKYMENLEEVVGKFLAYRTVEGREIGDSTKKYISSKFLQHHFNSENLFEDQNADDTRVDLNFEFSDFFIKHLSDLCPGVSLISLYLQNFRNENAYEDTFELKNKLIAAGRQDLAVRADLFMGKALYFLEMPSIAEINEAHRLLEGVVNDIYTTKGDRRIAQFYSLMLCFRENGQPATLSDEELAQRLLELSKDNKLPNAQRNWVQARLMIMCQEGRTNLISEWEALTLCKEIFSYCVETDTLDTLLHDISWIYGGYFALRCKTVEEEFLFTELELPTMNKKLQALHQYSLCIRVLQGHKLQMQQNTAAAKLTELKSNSILREEDKLLADLILKNYEDSKAIWSNPEEILKLAKESDDASFLFKISPILTGRQDFLHQLIGINHNFLSSIYESLPQDDEFMVTVLEKNCECLQNATRAQKQDVNFLSARLDIMYWTYTNLQENLKRNDHIIEKIRTTLSLALSSADASLNDSEIIKLYNQFFIMFLYSGIGDSIKIENKKVLLFLFSDNGIGEIFRSLNNCIFLRHIPDSYLDDVEFMSELLIKIPSFLPSAGPSVRDNDELLSRLIDIDPKLFLLASERLRNNFEFVLKMVEKNIIIQDMVSAELKNKLFMALNTTANAPVAFSPQMGNGEMETERYTFSDFGTPFDFGDEEFDEFNGDYFRGL